MKTNTQKGFTLVELAIVMTIIGLLIGGILKGQEMIQNARVTATIAQVKAIEAATTTFRDAYNGMPGDLVRAHVRVPGCTDYCGISSATTSGDGIVGDPSWSVSSAFAPQSNVFPVASGSLNATTPAVGVETTLFWAELSAANLLSGLTAESISGATYVPTWGGSHPTAKIAGGFVIGYARGNSDVLPGVETGMTSGVISGNVLALVQSPGIAPSATTGVITATKAAQLDRKMDDGIAYSGSVQAYGVGSTAANQGCAAYNATTPTSSLNYQERSGGNNCGLFFQIQS